MYKVAFFPNPEEQIVLFKEFATAEEAFEFAEKHGEDILEIKRYGTKTIDIKDSTHIAR